jgi:aryl-alcohol dehydrogenase-like predicted oxidoreductase
MRTHGLGKSPLLVSQLCLGTMMFGDQTDLAAGRSTTSHPHERGVNFIDTADVYSTSASAT